LGSHPVEKAAGLLLLKGSVVAAGIPGGQAAACP
jgi:hypothetical protein